MKSIGKDIKELNLANRSVLGENENICLFSLI